MYDKIEICIEGVLEKTPKRYNDLKKDVETELGAAIPPATFSRKLKSLIRQHEKESDKGIIKILDKEGKIAWYCCPRHEMELREKLGIKSASLISPTLQVSSQESRISHTKDIKVKVIEPWLKNFPLISWDGIFIVGKDISETIKGNKEGRFVLQYYYPEILNEDGIEQGPIVPLDADRILFRDFEEHHINPKLGSNPVVLWENFNIHSREYWDKLCKFIDDIAKNFILSVFDISYDATIFPYLIREFIWILWKKTEYPKKPQFPQDLEWAEDTPPRGIKLMKCFSYGGESIYLVEDFRKKIILEMRKSNIFLDNEDKIKELINLLKENKKIKKVLLDSLKGYAYVKKFIGDCPYI